MGVSPYVVDLGHALHPGEGWSEFTPSGTWEPLGGNLRTFI
jgi:hypothetical protein